MFSAPPLPLPPCGGCAPPLYMGGPPGSSSSSAAAHAVSIAQTATDRTRSGERLDGATLRKSRLACEALGRTCRVIIDPGIGLGRRRQRTCSSRASQNVRTCDARRQPRKNLRSPALRGAIDRFAGSERSLGRRSSPRNPPGRTFSDHAGGVTVPTGKAAFSADERGRSRVVSSRR